MGDEEMERFEITDYDYENEFNIRPRHKLSKKQQMLGVFADDSDEEDERVSKKTFNKRPKNYSAPIGFIAGGVQQAGKPKEEEKSDDEDEDTGRPRRGDADYVPNSSDDSEEETPRNQRSMPSFNLHLDGEIAGLRKKRAPISTKLMNTGVGNWEMHTKGIGSKLLMKMGFEPGKGLGKTLQGINTPVEATLRKGRGAIGAYGPEKTPKLVAAKSTNEEDVKVKKSSQWKKIPGNENKKGNFSYRSVEQVIEDGRLKSNKKAPTINTELAKVKVIDMTGPEQRVLAGYHSIMSGQKKPDENTLMDKKEKLNFFLPELQHNLNMLVDMCEQDIIQNDRRTRYLGDRVISLEAEEETLVKNVQQNAQLIGNLEKILATINKLVDRQNEMTLKDTIDAFKNLQEKHFEEYKYYDLGDLACSFVVPKFKDYLSTWNALMQPSLPLNLFKDWKKVLDFGPMNMQSRNFSPYDQLIWSVWMPIIRGAIRDWPCRQPELLIDFLDVWTPILPTWILGNLTEMVIFPKLTLEVEEWNPLTDTVPIHTWIHPWLPIMRDRMDTQIYPIIRRKLGSALCAWHPSDRSARLMLEPWAQVFAKGDMEAFLVKNILPKLQIVLSELIINPHQQHLDQWNWVYDWKDLISSYTMASLLDKFFFPKWLQVLGLWLNHTPNYDQVTNWYSGWKSMLSEKLLMEPLVKEHFRKALEMMNRAVSIPQGLAPGSVEQVSYLTSLERSKDLQQSQIPAMSQPRMERLAEAVRTASQIPQGFKDLVQKKCEERGILFMPIANRYREGKQIYKVGNVQAYLDGNVIFVCHNGTSWNPTHLNALLDVAEI